MFDPQQPSGGDDGSEEKNSKKVELSEQSVALTDFVAKALVAAENLRTKKKAVEGFPLGEAERVIIAELPTLSARLKKKLVKRDAEFGVAESASILLALADALLEGEPLKRLVLLLSAKKLMDCLQANVMVPVARAKRRKAKTTDAIYQLKITLKDSHPPMWRRIQVRDCTLDRERPSAPDRP